MGEEVELFPFPPGGVVVGTGAQGTMFNTSTLGSHTLTYHYTDKNGCSDSSSVTLVAQDCTGLSEGGQISAVTVFPNPASETVYLSGLPQNALIRLYDSNGKLLIESFAVSDSHDINLGNVARGLYLLTVSDGVGQVNTTFRLVRE